MKLLFSVFTKTRLLEFTRLALGSVSKDIIHSLQCRNTRPGVPSERYAASELQVVPSNINLLSETGHCLMSRDPSSRTQPRPSLGYVTSFVIQPYHPAPSTRPLYVCVCAVSYTHLDVYKRQLYRLFFLTFIVHVVSFH